MIDAREKAWDEHRSSCSRCKAMVGFVQVGKQEKVDANTILEHIWESSKVAALREAGCMHTIGKSGRLRCHRLLGHSGFPVTIQKHTNQHKNQNDTISIHSFPPRKRS